MMPPTATQSRRPYKGLDPEERIAERRHSILAAGLELFGRRGYHGVTMTQLSAESGVPHRYLTRIFADKEAVLRALYLGITREVKVTTAEAMGQPAGTPAAMIRQGVQSACEAFLSDTRKARINCIEVVGVSPEFEQLRRREVHDFAQLIKDNIHQLAEQGQVPDADYHHSVIGLVGAFHELMTEWVLTPPPERPDIRVLAERIAQFFWGTLLAAQTPLPK